MVPQDEDLVHEEEEHVDVDVTMQAVDADQRAGDTGKRTEIASAGDGNSGTSPPTKRAKLK